MPFEQEGNIFEQYTTADTVKLRVEAAIADLLLGLGNTTEVKLTVLLANPSQEVEIIFSGDTKESLIQSFNSVLKGYRSNLGTSDIYSIKMEWDPSRDGVEQPGGGERKI